MLLFLGLFFALSFTSSASIGNVLANKRVVHKADNFKKGLYFKDCTVTIKGTVNGKKIDLTVKYQADDCAAGAVTIIKGVMK